MKYLTVNKPEGSKEYDWTDLTGDNVKVGTPPNKEFGLVVLCNKTSGERVKAKATTGMNKTYPADQWEPIGIIVIPASNTVVTHKGAGKGKDIMLSLKYMNYSTPDSGGSAQSIMWGGSNPATDEPGITNYQKSVKIDLSDENVVVADPPYTLFASDKFNHRMSTKNPKLGWVDAPASGWSEDYCPVPFLEDGSANPQFYQPLDGSGPYVNTEFCGVENTTTLINHCTGQPNWKIDPTIENKQGENYHPAACCCWRYHTVGTKQGDWYLPAYGEGAYIIAQFNSINQTGSIINSEYGSDKFVALADGHDCWLSSEYSSSYAWAVSTGNGSSGNDGKDDDGYVRACSAC